MALQVGGWGKVPSKTVKELYRPEACSVQQRVPDLPVPLRAHVAIEVKDLGLLVCGGTSEAHNSVPGRDCFIFSHKDGEWKQFHKLNIGRINAYVKLTGDKIIIIGGSSTDPFNTCLQTEEVLELDAKKMKKGWKVRETSQHLCSKGSEVVAEFSC